MDFRNDQDWFSGSFSTQFHTDSSTHVQHMLYSTLSSWKKNAEFAIYIIDFHISGKWKFSCFVSSTYSSSWNQRFKMSKFNSPLLFGCLVWIESRKKRIELAISKNFNSFLSWFLCYKHTKEYVPTTPLQIQNS